MDPDAVGATPSHREITLSGVRLAYDDEGQGPPVVCLHAIGHGASDFRRLRARLRDRFRVIALDWPGHERSQPDVVPASVTRYAELLRQFLAAVNVERAVLVGNSIGGGAAIRVAVDEPERVRGLVLLNPAGLDSRDRVSSLMIAVMVRLFGSGAKRAPWFPAAFAQYYKLVLARPEAAEHRARIVASAFEIAPILLQAWRSFAHPDSDLRVTATRVEQPVLLAWAIRDCFVQLKRNLPGIQAFPDHRLETFDAGHCPQLETPQAFERSVERFLATLS